LYQSVQKNEDITHIRVGVDRIVLCLYNDGKTGLVAWASLEAAEAAKHGKNVSGFNGTTIPDLRLAAIIWMLLILI